MKQYTKAMIRKTFVKQLNEHPLSKVTVKSIVEECDINRNTFYYHYRDIYEVLTEIFDMELQKVIDKYNENFMWEDSFNLAVKSCIGNKVAVFHIYNSVRREELENYIFTVSGNLMNRLVASKSQGLEAAKEDLEIIASFYQSALTQMVISWIAGGMLQDPYYIIDKVGHFFDGSLETAIERSHQDFLKTHNGL